MVGTCIDCVRFENDDSQKQIKGLARCERHYRSYRRRQNEDELIRGSENTAYMDQRRVRAAIKLSKKFYAFETELRLSDALMLITAEELDLIRGVIQPTRRRLQAISTPGAPSVVLAQGDPDNIPSPAGFEPTPPIVAKVIPAVTSDNRVGLSPDDEDVPSRATEFQ